MRNFLRLLFGFVLPCDGEGEPGDPPAGGDPTGGTPPATGGEPATGAGGPGDGEPSPLDQLETANARITELEGNRATEVQARAEELLLEVMPEYGEQRMVAPMPSGYDPRTGQPQGAEPGYIPGAHQPIPGQGDLNEEITPEDRMQQGLDHLTQRQAAVEDEIFASKLDRRLDAAQRAHPHMDRYRVMGYLANAGAGADRINIEKLCEISHNKELRRLTDFADQHHQGQLAQMRGGSNPPPLPGPGTGTPAPGEKVTRENASKVFAERLAARGFGR